VTGKYPFEGSTVYTLFENIARAEYQIPSWLAENHQALADLIRGMLEPDKNRRLSLKDIAKHAWLQGVPENEEEPLEIVPSRTLFTPEFLAEMSSLKEEGLRNDSHRSPRKGHKKNISCVCIIV